VRANLNMTEAARGLVVLTTGLVITVTQQTAENAE
jgi:hypothetical protein